MLCNPSTVWDESVLQRKVRHAKMRICSHLGQDLLERLQNHNEFEYLRSSVRTGCVFKRTPPFMMFGGV